MINYREHRGSLKESLETAKQFYSFEDFYKHTKFKKIERYGFDSRVNQELFIVTNDRDQVLGFIFLFILKVNMMENNNKFIKFMKDNNIIKLSDQHKENIYKKVVDKLFELGFETIAYDPRNIYTLFDMRSKDIFVRINPHNQAWPILIYGPYIKNFMISSNRKSWDIKVFKILESLGVKNNYSRV